MAGYYGADKERAPVWLEGGQGAAARYGLEAGAEVTTTDLARVMDGAAESFGVRNTKIAMYDTTYSAPKSVSVLWSDADTATRAKIETCLLDAANVMLGDLSQHAAHVRRGATPATQKRETAKGLVGAAYVEGTSREGDPQLQEMAELREKIASSGMPDEARERASKELDRLATMPSGAPEVGIIRTYVDWLIGLP